MFQISNCTNMTDHRRFFVFGHRYKINHSLSVAPTPRGRVGSSPGPPSPQGASFGQANVVAFGPEISQTRLPWPSELRRILEYTFGMSCKWHSIPQPQNIWGQNSQSLLSWWPGVQNDGLNPQKGWRPEGKSHCGVYFHVPFMYFACILCTGQDAKSCTFFKIDYNSL